MLLWRKHSRTELCYIVSFLPYSATTNLSADSMYGIHVYVHKQNNSIKTVNGIIVIAHPVFIYFLVSNKPEW